MNPPHPVHRRSGSVFIVVLIVCLGLVGMILLFGESMLMAYRGADNDLAGQQADQAIEGAARYAEYLLTKVTRPGAMPDPATFQADALSVGDATFWFIGTPGSNDSVNKPAFGFVDEASKLNLNTATKTMLMSLPDMTDETVSAITAWRSATAGGTGTTTLIPNASVKGARFETVEELALVTGTDQSLLYGSDTNLNHVLDPNEESSGVSAAFGASDSRIDSGLFEYVTVFSREPNSRSDGTQRLNVTKPFSDTLRTLLNNKLGSSRAQEIERRIRAAGPLSSVLHFYIRSGMTEAEFEKVASDLTAKDGTFVTGLVNVNTASQTVLICLPGFTTETAAQLTASRATQSQPPATLAWIVPILGEAAAIRAGPYLTANSYQLSADVAAVGRHGRGYRRTRFVIDTSTGTPRIVHRRNLSPLGWALGNDIRDTLAMKKEQK